MNLQEAGSDTAYSQLLVRFNFETSECTGGPAATVNTLSGADFKSRTPYNPNSPAQMGMPDFLLLELRDQIPESWDVYLSGWDRSSSMPGLLAAPEKYIGFHHPAGDVKKVSFSQEVESYGDAWINQFNQDFSEGGVARGSSGSGLFNGDKRLIGVASVAGGYNNECSYVSPNNYNEEADFFHVISYYKFSSAWDFDVSADKSLKPWLDPNNSGVTSIDPLTCSVSEEEEDDGGSSITDQNKEFGSSITIYPNPLASRTDLNVLFNFSQQNDIEIEVYNIAGEKERVYRLEKVSNGSYNLEVSDLANGIYFLKFRSNNQVFSKRVVINR